MGIKTPSEKTHFFSDQVVIPHTLEVDFRDGMTRVPDASFKWGAFKDCDENQFGNDWNTFIRSLDSTITAIREYKRSPTDLLSSRENDDLQVTLRPTKVVCESTQLDDDDEVDENDKYFNYCYADTQIPTVKMSMVLPKPHKKVTDNIILLNNNKMLYTNQINSPSSLDSICIPPLGTDYSVTICCHVVSRESTVVLKALLLYLSTGESYMVLIDRTCHLKNLTIIQSTKFGHLMTDTNVTRICWDSSFVQAAMKHQLGFTVGKCIDISLILPEFKSLTLYQSIDHCLKGWQDKNQFDGLKKVMEKWSEEQSCWNRPCLPPDIIKYCAVEGWALYSLYLKAIALSWFI